MRLTADCDKELACLSQWCGCTGSAVCDAVYFVMHCRQFAPICCTML